MRQVVGISLHTGQSGPNGLNGLNGSCCTCLEDGARKRKRQQPRYSYIIHLQCPGILLSGLAGYHMVTSAKRKLIPRLHNGLVGTGGKFRGFNRTSVRHYYACNEEMLLSIVVCVGKSVSRPGRPRAITIIVGTEMRRNDIGMPQTPCDAIPGMACNVACFNSGWSIFITWLRFLSTGRAEVRDEARLISRDRGG